MEQKQQGASARMMSLLMRNGFVGAIGPIAALRPSGACGSCHRDDDMAMLRMQLSIGRSVSVQKGETLELQTLCWCKMTTNGGPEDATVESRLRNANQTRLPR